MSWQRQPFIDLPGDTAMPVARVWLDGISGDNLAKYLSRDDITDAEKVRGIKGALFDAAQRVRRYQQWWTDPRTWEKL